MRRRFSTRSSSESVAAYSHADMNFGAAEIRQLAQLLREGNESESSDDDLPPPGLGRLGPGDIGKGKSSDKRKSSDCHVKVQVGESNVKCGESIDGSLGKVKASGGNDIWHEKEVPTADQIDDSADPRPAPSYDMVFRQKVSPEDVYLGMGARSPATASCEDLVLRVAMPGEAFSAVHLNVTRQRVDVRSPAFRLGLPLPHPVDPDASSARWEADSSTLVVTLRLQREFDFVNF